MSFRHSARPSTWPTGQQDLFLLPAWRWPPTATLRSSESSAGLVGADRCLVEEVAAAMPEFPLPDAEGLQLLALLEQGHNADVVARCEGRSGPWHHYYRADALKSLGRLQEAAAAATQALALQPGLLDALPCAGMPTRASTWLGRRRTTSPTCGREIVVNTGLQRPKQEAHDLLQQAVARCPGYRRAYHAYLHRLGKRWGGEDLEAVTFALTVHSQAPEGSPLHALVPRVLVESVIDERLNDYSLLRTNLGAVQAMQSAWPRGLGSPRYQEDIYTLNDRNKFAFVLYACGLDREARVEFDKIGSRKTPYPWGMLGDPNAFEVVRKVVYR